VCVCITTCKHPITRCSPIVDVQVMYRAYSYIQENVGVPVLDELRRYLLVPRLSMPVCIRYILDIYI